MNERADGGYEQKLPRDMLKAVFSLAASWADRDPDRTKRQPGNRDYAFIRNDTRWDVSSRRSERDEVVTIDVREQPSRVGEFEMATTTYILSSDFDPAVLSVWRGTVENPWQEFGELTIGHLVRLLEELRLD